MTSFKSIEVLVTGIELKNGAQVKIDSVEMSDPEVGESVGALVSMEIVYCNLNDIAVDKAELREAIQEILLEVATQETDS